MADTDFTHIKPVVPRTTWLAPMDYEINIDQATSAIDALINEPIDKKQPRFGTYEEAKSKIKQGLEIKKDCKQKG